MGGFLSILKEFFIIQFLRNEENLNKSKSVLKKI